MSRRQHIATMILGIIVLFWCGGADGLAQATDSTLNDGDRPIFQIQKGIAVALPSTIISPVHYARILDTQDSSAVVGYHVYRKEQGLAWQKLTQEPVRMASKEDFLRTFGEDFFKAVVEDGLLPKVETMRQQSLVFSALPPDEQVWQVLSQTTDPNDYAILMLSPDILRLTGLLYADTTALPGISYSYMIRPLTLKGEGKETELGSIVFSQLPIIPSSLISVQAKYEYNAAAITVEYFPRREMTGLALFRLEEGKEPLVIAEIGIAPPELSTPRASATFLDTSLAEGTLVRYRAYGSDIWGNRTEPKESNEVFAFDTYEDYYVTNPTISVIGDEAIELSWADDKHLPYYQKMIIYRATEYEGPYLPMDTVAFSSMSWRDTAVFPENFYYYRFQRVYVNGDTSSTSPYFTAQFEVLVPPPPPHNPQIAASKEGIALSWEEPRYKFPVLAYYVYRSTDSGNTFFLMAALDSATKNWTDTTADLYPYQPVHYYVAAMNLSRVNGEHSDTIAVLPYLDTLTLPANALWKPVPDEHNTATIYVSNYAEVFEYIAGYNIYRANENGENRKKLNDTLLTADTFRDKSALSGQTYLYYHTIVDKRGFESDFSEPEKITLQPMATTYPRVREVAAEYEDAHVRLTWEPIEHESCTGYIVLRSDGKSSFKEIAKVAEHSFVDAIKKRVVYRYKVVAILGEITYYEEPDDPKKLPDKLSWKEQDEYVKKVLRFCETETNSEKKRSGVQKAFAHAREKRFTLNDLYFQFLNEVKNVNTN